MNWLHYLLEANLYLMVFYAGYCLFLNKETYYTLNRAYLLFSCMISFLLPVLQIGALKPAEPAFQTVVLIAPSGAKPVVTAVTTATPVTMQDVLVYTYLLGVAVLTIVLLFKLFKLAKMTRAANKMVDDQYKMISIEGSNAAFSFFNYLFIGSKTAGSDIIIRHELVHIRQKHSADIIFMEIMKIMNWFNPFIYLVQISLKTVHEYIADEQTAALEPDALTYSSFLVNNAYGLNGSSITHSFFNYNLLKKRIIMLNQKRSGNLARLKYLMAVPICAGMLCASTLGFSKTYGWVDLAPSKNAQTAKLPLHKDTPNDGKFIYVIKPTSYSSSRLEEIKAELEKRGYKMTYSEKNMGTKQAQVSVNIEKLSKKGTVQSVYGTFNLDEMKQDGYVIMFGGDEKSLFMSDRQKENSVTPKDISKLLPPPPPVPSVNAPQPKAVTKRPPPLPPAAPKSVSNKPSKIIDVQLIPPPPPPRNPFDSLCRYVGRHVRYSSVARENLIAGRVIATFNINNGKIEDVKITRGLTDIMDGEVVRVLKSYDGPLSVKSGKYAIPVSYSLVDENGNYVGKAPEYKATANDKNKPGTNNIIVESGPTLMLNEVVITAYTAKRQ